MTRARPGAAGGGRAGRTRAGALVAAGLAMSTGAVRADPSPAAPGDGPPALPRLTLGVRIGVGHASLRGLVVAPAEPDAAAAAGEGRVALAVGGTAVGWLGPLGLQAEAMLARKGAGFRFPGATGARPVEGTIDLTYLDLGLLARAQAGRTGELRPFALAGPALSVKLASSSSVDGESMEAFDLAATDFALVVGAGLAFGPVRRGFTAEVRYAHGLVDVTDEAAGADDAVVETRVVLVLAGFEL